MRAGAAASLVAVGGAVMALAASAPGSGRVTTGPVARYQMDVSTTNGFGGLVGGHINPMSMMFGRGSSGGAHHSLHLRLGSSLAPTGGSPSADHFMPAGADLGQSVPLVTPQHAVTSETGAESDAPPNFQRPKGRMLIFWGCGAHAGPGQPVVIDFSKLAQGQMPPHLFSSDVPREIGPTEANSRTYGEWPNAKSRKSLSERSSLLGAHSVKGNYSPDIQFTLNQDFMAPLQASSRDAPDGSVPMNWNAVPAATGYYATLFGGQDMGNEGVGDVVMWSSAARREFSGGLSNWLAPATVARLIGEHIVMPPTQTNCTVPAEVKQAAGQFMMVQLYAYGPEADFAYPPRPANPKAPWHVQWTAKARYKSTTGLILGMPGMDTMSRDESSANDNPRDTREREKQCRPHGLGGLLKSAAGIGC